MTTKTTPHAVWVKPELKTLGSLNDVLGGGGEANQVNGNGKLTPGS